MGGEQNKRKLKKKIIKTHSARNLSKTMNSGLSKTPQKHHNLVKIKFGEFEAEREQLIEQTKQAARQTKLILDTLSRSQNRISAKSRALATEVTG